MDITAYALLLPEIGLAFSALLLLLWGAFKGDEAASGIFKFAVAALFVVASMTAVSSIATYNGGALTIPGKMYVVSNFVIYSKCLVLLAAIVALLMAPKYLAHHNVCRPEYSVLVMTAVLGMMLMISSSNLLMLYIGLELQSLSLYVLAAFRRDDVKSSEAGLKYFVLGALASGLLLYGISLVYGFTGTLDYVHLAQVLKASPAHPIVTVGLIFIVAALAFKISAAPLHMWAPDVYEGAPTPVTAFFSVAPKVAAVSLMVNVLTGPFLPLLAEWKILIIGLSAFSMVIGSFAAIGQENIKRMLAYSSIGHVGFILMALAAGTSEGVTAMMVYLTFYVVMSLGAFAVVLMMSRDGAMVEQISDLSGLSRKSPAMAACMAVIMFSMAGIPPMVGFFSKLYVFMAALHAGLYSLAIIGAIASVVGAYYYLRVIKVMYFDEPSEGFEPLKDCTLSATMVTAGTLVLFGLAVIAPITTLIQFMTPVFVAP